MKKLHFLFASLALLLILTTSCQPPQNPQQPNNWELELNELMPYLGHRNWIVIADMAYPLQAGAGITTLFAPEPYPAVLSKVKTMIDKEPHIFAHIYRDKELSYISEDDMPGIPALRTKMDSICGDEATSLPHEKLIANLDEAGRLYRVIIIKTPLTLPYTTTFFQLDCAYWNGEQQQKLDEAMQQ